jgi:hypothetical protein
MPCSAQAGFSIHNCGGSQQYKNSPVAVGQQSPCKFCAIHAGNNGHDALSNVGDDDGKGVGSGVGSGVGRLVLVSRVGTGFVGASDGGGRGVGFCNKDEGSNKTDKTRAASNL